MLEGHGLADGSLDGLSHLVTCRHVPDDRGAIRSGRDQLRRVVAEPQVAAEPNPSREQVDETTGVRVVEADDPVAADISDVAAIRRRVGTRAAVGPKVDDSVETRRHAGEDGLERTVGRVVGLEMATLNGEQQSKVELIGWDRPGLYGEPCRAGHDQARRAVAAW